MIKVLRQAVSTKGKCRYCGKRKEVTKKGLCVPHTKP